MVYAAPTALLVLLPLAVVAGLVLGPRVARSLGASRAAGILLVLSVALILVITFVPMEQGSGSREGLACLIPDLGVLTSGSLLRISDASLNVVLFAPLGFAIALVPRPWRVRLLVAAILLPWAIETVQLLLPGLNRTCESVDLTTNLLGLGLGLAAGLVAGLVATRLAGVRAT